MSGDGTGELGWLLREHRAAAGLTQEELAVRAELSVRAVRDIERGRVPRPQPGTLHRLAEALQLRGAERAELAAAVDGAGPAGLWIGVLGPTLIRRHRVEVPVAAPKLRALLGLLALHAPAAAGTDEIVAALWDTDPPETRLDLVKGYAARLRALLEPDHRPPAPRVLVRRAGGYALECGSGQLDLLRFGELTRLAQRAEAAGDTDAALARWAEALDCWRGPLLADLDPALRAHPAAAGVARRRVDAVLAWTGLQLDAGRHQPAVDVLTELVGTEPLHEALHARLMLALAGSGQQAAAFAVYTDIRRRLVDELGVQPGAELQVARRQLLHPAVAGPGQPAPAPVPAAAPDPSPAAGPGTIATESPAIGPAPAPAGHPGPAQLPPGPAAFVGRRAELRALTALLPRADRAAAMTISLIAGPAGVGKTALALRWAHRVRARFPDGQLYVDLRGFGPAEAEVRPEAALRGFLAAFGVPPAGIPDGLDAQAALFRSVLAGRRVLLVLDNARNADQVRPLLPAGPGCVVVITSRDQLAELVAAEGARPLTLDLLSAAEAEELLARRLDRGRIAAEPAAVGEIIARCARLPLALTIVAARAAIHPGFRLTALAAELAGAGSLDGLAGADPAGDVRAVFSWSYRALSEPAARLFRLLGLHPGPDAATTAVASLAGQPVDQVRAPLAELTRASLLAEHIPGRYTHHDLLRSYAADLSRNLDPAEARAATARLLDHYLRTAYAADRLLEPHREPIRLAPPEPGARPDHLADEPAATAWLAAEQQVLLAALQRAVDARFDPPAWQLAWSLHTFLDRRGDWRALAASWRLGLQAADRLPDPAVRAHLNRGMAGAQTRLGNHAEARAHLQSALDLYTEAGDLTGAAHVHHNFTMMWERAGRPELALWHAEQALTRYQGQHHLRGQAEALNSVGWYHALLGQHAEALVHCSQALQLFQRLDDQWGAANAWDSLGYAQHHRGDHAEAITCYQHAVTLMHDLGDRYYEATVRTHLGDAQLAVGDPGAARTTWEQALHLLTELDHPDAHDLRQRLDALAPDRPGPAPQWPPDGAAAVVPRAETSLPAPSLR